MHHAERGDPVTATTHDATMRETAARLSGKRESGEPSINERLAMRQQPSSRPIGFHHWSDLTFLHWRLPATEIARLIPAELTLDTWDGDAWVGLVPFFMSGVRPWWSPAMPGVSNFAETNVRTYVHHDGLGPGVWFFSLDAASSLAVRLARWRWNLNYFRATMSVTGSRDSIAYSSHRLWPQPSGGMTDVEIQVCERGNEGNESRTAQPGTLEFFLVERYVMYMQRRNGGLRRGHVWHQPYPLHEVKLTSCRETLLAHSGITVDGSPCHVAYSPGVDVKIYAPFNLSD
ncbi:MAG: DUF2071 domain-containing protein [Pirellulales bacterium]|nr:DUF2071 domain-containing protein [Pirellulales bacterium]